jgi:hypothetical protein
MSTKKLLRAEWQRYFDRVSKALEVKLAEIEVASLALGDQVEAKWLPLTGIVYDPKSDILEITLEGLDHMIPRPRDIAVQEEQIGLASIEVTDAGGVMQIVKLRDPLLLPPPSESSSR